MIDKKLTEIENKIIEVREQKVILDNDVAELYGVETREINQAVKNNPEKFPEGYILELTPKEWEPVKSKILISPRGGGKVKLPKAFAEKGLYMLATILKSPKATQTTIYIIETFARIKNLSQNFKALTTVQDEQQKQNLLQKSGKILGELLDDNLTTSEKETTIELNLALLKIKHTTKKTKK